MQTVHAISNPAEWYCSLQRAYMALRDEVALEEACDVGRLMAVARLPLENLLDWHSSLLADAIADAPDDASALIAASDLCLAQVMVGWRLAADSIFPQGDGGEVPLPPPVFLHFEADGRLTPVEGIRQGDVADPPPWTQAHDLHAFVTLLCGSHRVGDVQDAIAQRRLIAVDLTAAGFGPRHFRALVCPFHDGSGILGVQDTTAQHAARNADFQRRKLESLGQLAGGIAHEINNLLQPIVTLTQMTLDDHLDDEETRADLSVVLDCAHRAANVVRDILAFARRSAPLLTPLPLIETLRHEIIDLADTLPNGVMLAEDYEPQETPLGVLANRPELGQILRNLIKNAVDATNGQGVITIAVRQWDLDEGDAFLVALPTGRYARISIGDDGPGIDPALLNRIFDPFFTTKDIGKGTGLGLAIVRSIIQSWGGGILARSNVEKGAVFDLYLKIAPLPAQDPNLSPASSCWDTLWQKTHEE